MHVDPTYVSAAKRLKQEQPDLFRRVRAGELTLTEAMREVKEERREEIIKANRRLVRSTRPLPMGTRYQTLVIDPPWDYEREGFKNRMILKPPFATSSLDQIAELPVGDLADRDAHLYLWITNLFLPRGFELLEGWGSATRAA
jgi:hypothetical protein